MTEDSRPDSPLLPDKPGTEAQLPPPGRRPLFRIEVAVILAVIAALIHGRAASYYARQAPLDRLQYPVATAIRLTERDLEFREAVLARGDKTGLERWIYRLTSTLPDHMAQQALKRFAELVERRAETRLVVHYAVLLGELGRTNALLQALQPRPRFSLAAELTRDLEWVYLRPTAGAFNPSTLLAQLEPGWAHDMLAARMASIQGRASEAASLRLAARERGELYRRRNLIFLFADGLCVGAGLAVMVWAICRRIRWKSSPDPSFVPWAMQDAVGILALVNICALAIAWLFAAVEGPFFHFLRNYSYLLPDLIATAALVQICLLQRHGWTWRNLVSPRHPSAEPSSGQPATTGQAGGTAVALGTRWWGAMMLVVVAADVLGWWILDQGLGAVGLRSHWAEGLDENILFGSRGARGALLQNGVLFGPLFEEIFFRAVLFGTLRTRFAFLPSAGLSSFLFAATHWHYSLPSLLSVFVLGLVCCAVYERTRSLLPIFAGHALTNLLVLSYQLVLYG